MIPYRDTLSCRRTPWMTWTLILVNAAVFIVTRFMPEAAVQRLVQLHGLIPARYAHPAWAQAADLPTGDYTPFITSMFLHGSGWHLLMNMWLLWIFGDNIEDNMGPWRFLAFYVLCGVFAGLLLTYGEGTSTFPAIGASAAIAGVLGAYYFLYPYARIVIWVLFLPIFVEVPAIAFLGIWVMIQLYQATTAMSAASSYVDVSWLGHLGGFIAGMLCYRLFLRREAPAEP
jgi:membrane associated rhomboid family serine protease